MTQQTSPEPSLPVHGLDCPRIRKVADTAIPAVPVAGGYAIKGLTFRGVAHSWQVEINRLILYCMLQITQLPYEVTAEQAIPGHPLIARKRELQSL